MPASASVFGRPDRPEPGRPVPDRARLCPDARGRADGARGAALFEAGEDCGDEANMAKMLAAEASWEAAEACVQTHGGFGFAEEYDVERKFRETRLYQVAPISTNLILSYICRARARHAALLLKAAAMLPLDGLLVDRPRTGGRRAALHAAACRCRRPRHQDRARRRRDGAPLRQGRARHQRLFRLAEPRQGERGPRHQGRGATASSWSDGRARPTCSCRTSRPAPHSGLGLGAADLVARYPRLIAVDIVGYRQDSEARDMRAYDMLIQAESGICAVTGTPDNAGQGRRFHGRRRDRHERPRRDSRGAARALVGPARARLSRSPCSTPWPT